jgi:hypothetical protein
MYVYVDLQSGLSANFAGLARFVAKTCKNPLKRQKILANQGLL